MGYDSVNVLPCLHLEHAFVAMRRRPGLPSCRFQWKHDLHCRLQHAYGHFVHQQLGDLHAGQCHRHVHAKLRVAGHGNDVQQSAVLHVVHNLRHKVHPSFQYPNLVPEQRSLHVGRLNFDLQRKVRSEDSITVRRDAVRLHLRCGIRLVLQHLPY